VRLFNPFVTERGSSARRLLALALAFKRLNHRMHNKLFIADGALAIVGGRNLTDEYFLRGSQNNFIDFDVMLTGSAVPELNAWYDLYWNNTAVYPVQAIALAAGGGPATPEVDRAVFDDVTRADPRPDVPMAPEYIGAPAFSTGLARHTLQFIAAPSFTFADSPRKIDPANNSISTSDTLAHRFLLQFSDTLSEALLFSPYFIPRAEALARIEKLRADGVKVGVVTNSLAVSDEPRRPVRTRLEPTQARPHAQGPARHLDRSAAREDRFSRSQERAGRLDGPRPPIGRHQHRNRRAHREPEARRDGARGIQDRRVRGCLSGQIAAERRRRALGRGRRRLPGRTRCRPRHHVVATHARSYAVVLCAREPVVRLLAPDAHA